MGTIKKHKQRRTMKAITILLIALAINATMAMPEGVCIPCLAARNLDVAREGMSRANQSGARDSPYEKLRYDTEEAEGEVYAERNLAAPTGLDCPGCMLVHFSNRRMLGAETMGGDHVCCPKDMPAETQSACVQMISMQVVH